MKNSSRFLLSGLFIGLAFSVLLVRLTSLERENVRQREQLAVMRQTATQAREAFDRMQARPSQFDFERWDHDKAVSDLDAGIETLEIVSKER